MEGEAGGSVLALTDDEEREYAELKELYDQARAAVKAANEDLRKWRSKHPEFSPLDPEFKELNRLVDQANQRLNDAERRWKVLHNRIVPASKKVRHETPHVSSTEGEAEQRWKEARAAHEKAKEHGPKEMTRPFTVQIASQGPVPQSFCIVPMETITVYQKLLPQFQRPANDLSRPLYLLYGPRQFGKTTVALHLAEKIRLDSSIQVIYLRFDQVAITLESSFWSLLGNLVKVSISSSEELIKVLIDRGKRLCLILDEMDAMFDNESLTRNFISILSVWQTATFFHGFLGVGSYHLVTSFKQIKGGDRVSPFNLASFVKMEPFTIQQMENFFDQISVSYNFKRSTRLAIMDYSSGAPGVFGSLIVSTIDERHWMCEADKWQSWFKIQNFSDYMLRYNHTFQRIRTDLQDLSAQDWDALNYVLIHQKATSSTVVESKILDFGKLLEMGVLIEATGELHFSSEVMRRICMEAQPVREIDLMLSEDSPLELLSISLRLMRPSIIGHASVANRQSPSEAVFQFELYASIRALLQKYDSTRKVLAEARARGEKRLDITISNGSSYGFELKSNKLTRGEIEAAVHQAHDYKRLLGIEKMFMINFVPQGHVIDCVYRMDTCPDVKVIHIFYPDTYDQYELKYLAENGAVHTRKVSTMTA